MSEPLFDIFQGPSDKDAVWLDTVPGLANARHRLEEIAATAAPGEYFMFSPQSYSILARIDTRSSASAPQRKSAAGGTSKSGGFSW